MGRASTSSPGMSWTARATPMPLPTRSLPRLPESLGRQQVVRSGMSVGQVILITGCRILKGCRMRQLKQRVVPSLGVECGVTAPEPEEPFGPQDVGDGEQVDDQGAHPQPAEHDHDLVDLHRDEQRCGDDRGILAPALLEPQAVALGQLEDSVSQDAERYQK